WRPTHVALLVRPLPIASVSQTASALHRAGVMFRAHASDLPAPSALQLAPVEEQARPPPKPSRKHYELRTFGAQLYSYGFSFPPLREFVPVVGQSLIWAARPRCDQSPGPSSVPAEWEYWKH